LSVWEVEVVRRTVVGHRSMLVFSEVVRLVREVKILKMTDLCVEYTIGRNWETIPGKKINVIILSHLLKIINNNNYFF